MSFECGHRPNRLVKVFKRAVLDHSSKRKVTNLNIYRASHCDKKGYRQKHGMYVNICKCRLPLDLYYFYMIFVMYFCHLFIRFSIAWEWLLSSVFVAHGITTEKMCIFGIYYTPYAFEILCLQISSFLLYPIFEMWRD